MDDTVYINLPNQKCYTLYACFDYSYPEFLDMYGTIVAFSQQGLEKLNDEVTQDYFRSTNHRDGEAQKQLLLKLNRLEEMT